MGDRLSIIHIHTFLVYPRKRATSEISGAVLVQKGRLYEMLDDVYAKSDEECDVDISFDHSADGKQTNPCRSLITRYLTQPSLDRARHLAKRLEGVTTNRSGLGLFFVLVGREESDWKIVLSRFPADSGVWAEENKKSLNVEFLERVFMKNAYSYKAAVYRDRSISGGFWLGRAVDKQINNPTAQISDYWIKEFLCSNLRTTAAAGTRQLALAIKAAIRGGDLGLKRELAAAVTLAAGMPRKLTSVREFADEFHLSQAAKDAIQHSLKNASLAGERFQFDRGEFSDQLAFRSVELDSGVIMTAEAAEFDKVIKQEPIDGDRGRVRLSTEGRVTSEKVARVR